MDTASLSAANNQLASSDAALTTQDNAVCATVRLQITQQAVITRTAFQGTLDLDNGLAGVPLADISLTLNIRDSNGISANDKFVIRGPTATGFTTDAGTFTLAAGADGKLQFIFVPTQDAAPDDVVTYEIGGVLHYIENGTVIDVQLSPGQDQRLSGSAAEAGLLPATRRDR